MKSKFNNIEDKEIINYILESLGTDYDVIVPNLMSKIKSQLDLIRSIILTSKACTRTRKGCSEFCLNKLS